ncbi:dihydrofolate reductase family protein [Vibrio neptunius]|uniref:Dihydrofolate reductase n=1 Tax=Vibrio neptunius TaxID=170651 RepID=A0ABS3A2H8_9VIBR|nr:dihydrofolate reductase family protein [Vibrio neptunius]MBN3493772.1 dihydrofolate reductase [Vibrio neptunius]MBN3516268.1 dihydrofolate reductase [Vibrio neptunius]MBN3550213.1 dihydrofolate reductase [Vibrio neptunius]MBN3578523.1 dihydrofolate reductase [Vibrio neptunius]MCH9872188.1 dihydrofolate reductase [Vibrio neptunius]
MSNIVFIATSLDGYIADKEGGLDWLQSVPNPDNHDMGFSNIMKRIDALVMGRNTLDVILGFGGEWPYSKPVFVLSNTMDKVPEGYEDKVFLVKGVLESVLEELNGQGYKNLYIDGGKTVQSFLQQDLIDEMIITTIPVLLGGGAPLFGELVNPLNFKLYKSETYLAAIVQSHYLRD